MSLQLELLEEYDWVQGRLNQPDKLHNSYLISIFNNAISAIKDNFISGNIYYNKIVKQRDIVKNSLIYEETSPYVNLFTLAPKSYYMQDVYFTNLWKHVDIDSNILNIFASMKQTKYKNTDVEYDIPSKYILFALQSDSKHLDKNYSKELVKNILSFATNTQTHIIFKLHPFTNPRTRFLNDLLEFKANNLLSKYTHIISHKFSTNHLVNNAEQIWTFSSGVALQAVVANKKSVSFSNTNYAPAVIKVNCPEEAYYCSAPSTDIILRFLTWYYHKINLNVLSTNFEEALFDKCNNFFNKKLPVSQIFT